MLLVQRSTTIGLISDTHGLLRPEAVEALRGGDFIIHAGDIGFAEILEELGRIAPVTAVRGNNDRGGWNRHVPLTNDLVVAGIHIHVIHDLAWLAYDIESRGVRVSFQSAHQTRSTHLCASNDASRPLALV